VRVTIFDKLLKKKKKASFMVVRLEQGKSEKGKHIRDLKEICSS